MAIPEELVQQFRSVAIERLDRIEAAWAAVLSTLDESSALLVHRELHTLKGESKMLGFADVSLVCHKLEEMFVVAQARGYAIDEDFDLAVNMAIRFMAMLVRKKVGAQLGGIDLPGFIRQIDGILAEIRPEPRTRITGSFSVVKLNPLGRVSTALRARLAPMAVDLFIEYALARGLRRDRLRTSWHSLRDLIGIQRAVIGQGQLGKHKAGAQSLARELGKRVDVSFELGSTEATAEMLAAIDTAVLHIIRNAVDHGIESPTERVAAGKSANGLIEVRSDVIDDRLTISIADDGRGVSLEDVRARAIEVGLITPNEIDIADRWFELVCQPGFTTRGQASSVSGRGVGLDAVRVGVLEVGGSLTAKTTSGAGTSWHVSLPLPKITFDGHVCRVPGLPFPIVIDGAWELLETADRSAPVMDVAHRLGVTESRSHEQPHFFALDGRTIGVVTERRPQTVNVRRLVDAPDPATSEVVLIDTVEGLLIHLDRVFR